jgi:hypothetical protein
MHQLDSGNKITAAIKVLEAADYIQNNQNSEDLAVCKSMLLRIADVIMATAKQPIDQFIVENNMIQEAPPAQQKEHGCGENCECADAQERVCPTHIAVDQERNLPEFNVADTISKIKEEVENG